MPSTTRKTPARAGSLALLGCLLLVASYGPAAFADDEAEYLEAAETVLCDCGCHPQSVAACACGRAAELRAEMRAMVAGGMTGEEVIASYVAKHGEKILIAPDAEGFNLLAWLGPIAMLFVGIVGIVFLVRRWGPRKGAARDETYSAELSPDDPYVTKLRRELEELQ